MKFNVDFKELTSTFNVDFEENNAAFDFKLDQITAATAEHLKHAGALAVVSESEALKGEVSGEVVAASDISPVEHNVGVKVKSKNLWNHEYDKKDLSNCTAWAETVWDNEAVKKAFKPNTTYKIKYTATCLKTVENASKNSNLLGFALYDGKNMYPLGYSIANNNNVMIAVAGESTTIEETCTTPTNLDGFKLIAYTQVYTSDWIYGTFRFDNIMLEEGTTATAYTPYVEDLTAVSVKKFGKNLCELGTVTVTQTRNYFDLQYPLKAGITYRISTYIESTDTDNLEYSAVGFYDKVDMVCGNQWINRKGSPAEFTPSRDVTRLFLYPSISYSSSAGDTATFSNIMIVPKGVDYTYEPFIEPVTYPVNADGTVEGVTSLSPNMTLLTDTSGAVITANYIKDIDKAFAAQTIAIAMSGGE